MAAIASFATGRDAKAEFRVARRTGDKQETLGHHAVSGLDEFWKK